MLLTILLSWLVFPASSYFCEVGNGIFHLDIGANDIAIEAKIENGDLVIRNTNCEVWRTLDVENTSSWWNSKIAKTDPNFDILECGVHKTALECFCSIWKRCESDDQHCNVCGGTTCPDKQLTEKCPAPPAAPPAAPAPAAPAPAAPNATEEAPKVNETQMNNLMWILYFTVVVILIVIIYKYVKHKKYSKMEVVDDEDVEGEPNNHEIEMSTVDIEHQPYTDSSENRDNEIFN